MENMFVVLLNMANHTNTESSASDVQSKHQQTHKLISDVMKCLLCSDDNEQKQSSNQSHLKHSELKFKALLGACRDFLSQHDEELACSVSTLDMSDLKVHDTFQTIMCGLFCDKTNYGRIVAAICVSKKMIDRVTSEQRPKLIESIIGWLQTFVHDNLSIWIAHHGDWVCSHGFCFHSSVVYVQLFRSCRTNFLQNSQ